MTGISQHSIDWMVNFTQSWKEDIVESMLAQGMVDDMFAPQHQEIWDALADIKSWTDYIQTVDEKRRLSAETYYRWEAQVKHAVDVYDDWLQMCMDNSV